jgi:hypothetical protein
MQRRDIFEPIPSDKMKILHNRIISLTVKDRQCSYIVPPLDFGTSTNTETGFERLATL